MAYTSTIDLFTGVPLDPRYEHTLDFTSREIQGAYFDTKLIGGYRIEGCTYLRKEKSVKVGINVEVLEEKDISYCRLYNQGGKPRYYFIVNKEYKAEDVTQLHLELDVIQTYMFDWVLPDCLVEREHVANDSIGAHLLDEGLELGEYVSSLTYSIPELSKLTNSDNSAGMCVLIQSSVNLSTAALLGEPVAGQMLGPVYSGLALFAVPYDNTGVTVLNKTLNELSKLGKADGIINMWMYPKYLVAASWISSEEFGMEWPIWVDGLNTGALSRTARTSLDGYKPRNKKLYSYPYSFLYMHNNMGESAVYRYELFEENPWFEYRGTLSPDAAVMIYPRKYRSMDADIESGITLQGFPTCAWNQDAYLIWMAQNQNQQSFTMQSANVQAAVGAAQTAAGTVQLFNPTSDSEGELLTQGANNMYSAYQTAGSLMAQRRDAQIQPPQSKGAHSASVNSTCQTHTFTVCDMSVTNAQAMRLDSFFDMYGYKVDMVKKPQYNSRPIWNFIKTVGCVVLGDFDANDRRKVAAIFDKGITFWHNPAKIYDYSINSAALNVGGDGDG